MFGQLNGTTRLFPIIGDPIKYVESPVRLTRTLEERGYNGICVPMQVAADDLDAVMAGLTASRSVDGILVTNAAQIHRLFTEVVSDRPGGHHCSSSPDDRQSRLADRRRLHDRQ